MVEVNESVGGPKGTLKLFSCDQGTWALQQDF